jgi:hypothetical protein
MRARATNYLEVATKKGWWFPVHDPVKILE